MTLREDLSSGRRGLRWSLPDAFEPSKDGKSDLVARDRERRVMWLVRALPWRLDLRRDSDEVLRADLEEDARRLFEEAFEPVEWPPGSGEKRPPRTADPKWSPIVEASAPRSAELPRSPSCGASRSNRAMSS